MPPGNLMIHRFVSKAKPVRGLRWNKCRPSNREMMIETETFHDAVVPHHSK